MSKSSHLLPPVRRVLLALPTEGADGRGRIAGIYRWLGEGHDWCLDILRTRADFTRETVGRMLEKGFDGAIVGIPYSHEAGRMLVDSGLPLTIMTSDLARHIPAKRPKTAFSLIDSEAVGRTAALHFKSLGRFAAHAYVHDARRSSWSAERLKGFASVYRDCSVFSGKMESDNTIDRILQDDLCAFLTRLPHPTALLAANDIIAEQVLSACRTASLRVPEDISVLGVDNDPTTCSATRPTLSSVEPNFNEAGYRAAAMLDALMCGRSPHRWTKPPGVASLITRNSTHALSPATKIVQDAMAFIEENALSGITPADVIEHLRVSRSLANLRFRELTGKSIGQLLTERRLAECQRLLRTTDWPFRRIANAVGYASADVLRNLFRSHCGTGPAEYRRQRKNDKGKRAAGI